MNTKNIDCAVVCNALMDCLYNSSDEIISKLGLYKGRTHLLNDEQQVALSKQLNGSIGKYELGGSGMNVIRAMAILGAKTSFTGMVGKDELGQDITNKLKEINVQTNIYKHPKFDTGHCTVLVSPDGERTLNTYLGASCHYDANHLPIDDLKAAKVFHFTGYQWDKPNQIKAMLEAIEIAKNSKTLISLDVSDPFVVENNRDSIQSLIRKSVDIVFANTEEASLLYGSVDRALSEISSASAMAVIKLGADGAIVRRENEVFTLAAHDVQVIDTTGAGDSFAAGFLYGFIRDHEIETCMKMATILASDVITRLGVFYSEEALNQVKALDKSK